MRTSCTSDALREECEFDLYEYKLNKMQDKPILQFVTKSAGMLQPPLFMGGSGPPTLGELMALLAGKSHRKYIYEH